VRLGLPVTAQASHAHVPHSRSTRYAWSRPRSAVPDPIERHGFPKRRENSSHAVFVRISAIIAATLLIIFVVPVGIHFAWGLPAIFQPWAPPTATTVILTLIVIALAIVLSFVGFSWRHAEASRRDDEASMALAATAANVGLWNWDIAADKVWATAHCRAMLGIQDDGPFALSTFLDCLSSEDRSNLRKAIENAVTTGVNFEVECHIRLPDEQVRWFTASGHARCGRRLRTTGVTAILVDVTQRKEAEAESARQQEHVTHLTRVDILGALSGAIAHELNQPLSAILSNAQAVQRMLSRRSPDVVELGDALGDIIDDDNRAVEIIRHFRALLRKSEANFESVDLNKTVSDALDFARPGLRVQQIRTVRRFEPSAILIRGDQIQLQQVMLNLVLNATESMTANSSDNRVLTVSTICRNDSVEVVVSDNGPGIPPEALPRLFESFHSTKKHGLGLGLSISRSIVMAHGGTIYAGNNSEGGASFYLKLPPLSADSP